MAVIFTALGSLFATGGAAAGAATAGAATAGAAATGLSLSGLLQGIATVGGVMASIAAGNAEADAANAAAIDAETEQMIETLKGVERRSSIAEDMRDALGAQDVAYAASGVDLSFGTAAQARTDAFREADLALTMDVGDTQSRLSRLQERAANYRSAAKRAKSLGLIQGLIGFGQTTA